MYIWVPVVSGSKLEGRCWTACFDCCQKLVMLRKVFFPSCLAPRTMTRSYMSYVSRYSTAFWWMRWSAVIGVGRGCPLLLVLALLLVLLSLSLLSLVLLVRVDDCGISRWWYAKAYLLCLCRTFGPSPPTLRWATKDTLAWCVPWQLRLGGARWVEGWTLDARLG